ncbi:MAG: AmmeMemoRadiSam system radical SAM enzyme [candidate division WOR-3 bacterium]
MENKISYFYKKLDNKKVQCTLCPHFCTLSPGQTGLCFGRENIDGELIAINYGKVMTIADDPIEKKPLYHFHPKEYIISVAQFGCNLKCPFCQNYNISQNYFDAEFIPVDGLYRLIKNKGRKRIAFTYTEPLMWYEYIHDFGQSYSKQIDIVLVTNGTINEEPAKKLLPFVKAANIDLKSFNSDFYKKELKGDLESVKNFIKLSYEMGVHIEITNLLIPQKNDNPEEFKLMVDFISSVSNKIPLHISRYFPNYKYKIPPTPPERMIEFYNLAKEKLHYVYLGNLFDNNYSNTYCPVCFNLLIERNFYDINMIGINDKKCSKCNSSVDIIL